MPLNYSSTITPGTLGDANQVETMFQDVQTFVNTLETNIANKQFAFSNPITKTNADTPYSAQDLDYILADTSSGSLTILLPTIGSVRVKWINGSADVILNAGSGKTIDGVQTFTMATPKDCVVTDARTSGVHYLV